MAAKVKADWEKVAAHYRAGIRTLRDIADEFGITEGAIRKRAKAEEWPRDLSAERARQKVFVQTTNDPKDRAGFVYVIYLDDSAEKRFYKIGMSGTFSSRFESHQCASPFNICVAMAFYVANMRATERVLHEMFREKRVRGEWFELDMDDLKIISRRGLLI